MHRELALVPLAFAAAASLTAPADAKVVARDIFITMDQVDPSHASDMGKVHEARIFYDDAKIDPVTHHVAILHEQHTPLHIPFHPDAFEMPVGNAYLDLSAKPYAYHMAASPGVRPLPDGRTMWKPYAIVFDENTHRMTIRRQADGGLELSGKYVVGDKVLSGPDIDFAIYGSGPPPGMKWPPVGMGGPGGPGGAGGMTPPAGMMPPGGSRPGAQGGQSNFVAGVAADVQMVASPGPMGSPAGMGQMPPGGMPPGMPAGMKMPPPPPPLSVKRGRLVALALDITIDQVAPEDAAMYKVGAHDIARIVYNTADVDPVTKTVPILEESHLIMGHYHPNRETRASVLDMSRMPYRLTYISAPTHGRPLVIAFEGATQRMAVLARPDFHMLIAGQVSIDPKPTPYDPKHPEK